jgi:NitT/TauT family transport system substrate-binding protein
VLAQTAMQMPHNRRLALRLREAGMIKSNPNRIISEGTDWRFFNEVKRELKS